MSGFSGELQLDFSSREGPIVEVRTGMLKELIRTRIQFLGAPYLHFTPEGKSLQIVSDKDWVDWHSLEDALAKRMSAELNAGTPLSSEQFGLLAYSGGGVVVRIEYLVENYWWAECMMSPIEDYEEWKAGISAGPAAAVFHIEDSRFSILDTTGHPVWFTPEGL